MRSVHSTTLDADRFDMRAAGRHCGSDRDGDVARHPNPNNLTTACTSEAASNPPRPCRSRRSVRRPRSKGRCSSAALRPSAFAATIWWWSRWRTRCPSEARAFLRRNDWGKASALRLASEVHTREFYRPDLLVVDARDHRALILDIKRSVASHKPKALTELRSRMMAAALVTRDWLERECDAPAVERVEIAIIDGSGDPADNENAIFAIADLDRLLGIEGAGEASGALRSL
jgi:hypothetical protein